MQSIKAFLAAFLAAAAVSGLPAAAGESFPGGRFALVLIDVDSLSCSPCSAPLETLCRAVPPSVQEERIIGILTYQDGRTPDPKRAGIVRTKWTGYSRAGGIRIRASVDEAHVFNRMNGEGITVLLLDPSAGIIKRWAPPFPPGAVEAIVRFLLARESPIMEADPCFR